MTASDPAHNDKLDDDPVLRKTVRTYLNGTVFESGLQTGESLTGPTDVALKSASFEWKFIDMTTGAEADLGLNAADPSGLRFLNLSVMPLRMSVENVWYAGDGSRGQETKTKYSYDSVGNVTQIEDLGETRIVGGSEVETTADDIITTITYTTCELSSTMDAQKFPCPAPKPAGRISSLWNPSVCPTWTNIPAAITITNRSGELLRKRDGRQALCDNSSMTLTQEWYGPGDDDKVETELDYDPWGTYNFITYPEDANGDRYTVNYEYGWDEATNKNSGADDGHAHLTRTTDSHGLTATAVFDPITGRIREQTDPNGEKTTFEYDGMGRIKSITGPKEQGTPNKTIWFEYFPTAAGYAHAIAHHFDEENPTDPIDTVVFVDGTGRQTQTKQDAQVFTSEANVGGNAVMIVSGDVEYDPLGRPVKEWYPRTGPLGTAGTYSQCVSPCTQTVDPTVMNWRLDDLSLGSILPGGATTSTSYGFDIEPSTGSKTFATTEVDANGKAQVTFTDVHERILAVKDLSIPADPLTTTYGYDAIGQLVSETDSAGNVSRHSYDLLGRRTSTETPDGGLFETRYDDAGHAIEEVDPTIRALGDDKAKEFKYDFDRLVKIEYPDDTPDVTYKYGAANDAAGLRGRLIEVDDGAKNQKLTYDKTGNVAEETTIVKVNNYKTDLARNTFKTSFVYDGFGRLQSMTYPDTEVVSYTYDSGGQIASIVGVKNVPTDTNGDGFKDVDSVTYTYLDRLEYDEFGDRAFQQSANGVKTRYTYDANTRWLSQQLSNSLQREIQDLNYKYDNEGNVLEYKNDVPAAVSNLYGGPSTQKYEYDANYRVKHAEGTYSFAPGKVRTYKHDLTYDKHGNVSSKKQTDEIATSSGTTSTGKKGGGTQGNSGGGGGSGSGVQALTSYNFSPMSYSSTKPHQLTKAGGRTFEHDASGRMKRIVGADGKEERAYTWDLAGRLRTVKSKGSTTDYKYDDLGRLTIERGPSGETAYVNHVVHARQQRSILETHLGGGRPPGGATRRRDAEYKRSVRRGDGSVLPAQGSAGEHERDHGCHGTRVPAYGVFPERRDVGTRGQQRAPDAVPV